MQTLTFSVNVPDELVHRFRTLPDSDRRAFLETMNAFAVATLAENNENDENEEADADFPADIYLTHPLPPLLREPLGDALRAGFADIDAGRVTDGETFFAELRDYAKRK